MQENHFQNYICWGVEEKSWYKYFETAPARSISFRSEIFFNDYRCLLRSQTAIASVYEVLWLDEARDFRVKEAGLTAGRVFFTKV